MDTWALQVIWVIHGLGFTGNMGGYMGCTGDMGGYMGFTCDWVDTWDLRFAGDMGGYMGLLLGASVMTVCELLDLLIYNCARKRNENKAVQIHAEKNGAQTAGSRFWSLY